MIASDSPGSPSPRRNLALAGVCLAALLVWLAFSAFSAAIVTISRALDASSAALEWTNNAFGLAAGAFVLPAGRFGDQYGRRKMLILGLVILSLAGFATSLSPSVAWLIVGRAVMGLGAALILPATLALIPAMFPRNEQAFALGVWMAVAWGGQGAGPAIGGFLTQVLGWRSQFWMNLPFGALACLIILRSAPESRDEEAHLGVDVPGVVTSALFAFALIFATNGAPARGFADPVVLVAIALAVVPAVLFVVVERRAAHPMVDLHLFASREFDGALIANIVMNVVFAGLTYVLTIYLQDLRGLGPVAAGMLLLPSTITIVAFSPFGARWAHRAGLRKPILAGVSILGVGTLIVAVLSHAWLLTVGLLVLGAGIGMMSTPLSTAAVAGPPVHLAGTASGLFKMTSLIGGALGVAALNATARFSQGHQALRDAERAGLSPRQTETLKNALTNSALFKATVKHLAHDEQQILTGVFNTIQRRGFGVALLGAGLFAVVCTGLVALVWRAPRATPASAT